LSLTKLDQSIQIPNDSLIVFSRRRKDVNKENRNNVCVNQPLKKPGVVSVSHVSSTKTRKVPSSDTCVAESFDNAMIEKLTELPFAVDRNEWLATHSKFLSSIRFNSNCLALALFEHVNSLCSTITDTCTPVSCPSMSYPGNT
jgi:hypothetical protein